MTPQHDRTTHAQRTSPKQTPRLRLKPKAPHSGQIDRVLYNVGEWSAAPTKLAAGGRRVRLDGYQRQPINTVEVVGLDRNRIVLLTVPVDTAPAEAHCALMSAAQPNDHTTVSGIFAAAQHAD